MLCILAFDRSDNVTAGNDISGNVTLAQQGSGTLLVTGTNTYTGGIVIAVEDNWARASKLRGGNYIWIYDLSSEGLVYYAHNRDIYVRVGDLVKPGDTIATVGRTGLNAARKRSPTHLHLTFLKIADGYPRPENVFADLKRAHTVAR